MASCGDRDRRGVPVRLPGCPRCRARRGFGRCPMAGSTRCAPHCEMSSPIDAADLSSSSASSPSMVARPAPKFSRIACSRALRSSARSPWSGVVTTSVPEVMTAARTISGRRCSASSRRGPRQSSSSWRCSLRDCMPSNVPESAGDTSLDRVMHHGGEGDPVRYAELGEHMAQVGVDRVRRDVHPSRHGAVREALGDEQRHRSLGSGETSQPSVGRRLEPRAPGRAPMDRSSARTRAASIGARPLVASQRFAQQRRGVIPHPPCASSVPRPRRRRCTPPGRRLSGERDRLEQRLDVTVDQSSAPQRRAAHRGHFRCQRHPSCDAVGHLGGDAAMPQCQSKAHEVRASWRW